MTTNVVTTNEQNGSFLVERFSVHPSKIASKIVETFDVQEEAIRYARNYALSHARSVYIPEGDHYISYGAIPRSVYFDCYVPMLVNLSRRNISCLKLSSKGEVWMGSLMDCNDMQGYDERAAGAMAQKIATAWKKLFIRPEPDTCCTIL